MTEIVIDVIPCRKQRHPQVQEARDRVTPERTRKRGDYAAWGIDGHYSPVRHFWGCIKTVLHICDSPATQQKHVISSFTVDYTELMRTFSEVTMYRSRLYCILLISGADSTRHGGHVPPLLQMAGHGGTVGRRTANKKPSNCTDHHKSTHQND